MAKKEVFINRLKAVYNDLSLKKIASKEEIIAYLAQLTKNHYQKLHINKLTIENIKSQPLLINNIDKSDSMFRIFYDTENNELPLSELQYKKAINWLVETWNNLDITNTNHSTNESLVRIIQKVARCISDGPYIDLALGTGKLLENMPLVNIKKQTSNTVLGNNLYKNIQDIDLYNYGFDIDLNVRYLADALLNYQYKLPIVKIEFESRKFNDSIRNDYSNLKFPEWKEKNPVFIFDPPLGAKSIQEHPVFFKNTDLYKKIFKNNEINESSSDILFLINYLINADSKSSFIGIFPESILNNNTKEYPNLRELLIKEYLNYVISYENSNLSRLVILVGTKVKEKLNNDISLIKIYNTEGIKELVNILNSESNYVNANQNIIKNTISRENFDNLYRIIMPSRILDKNKIKKVLPLKTLTTQILENEKVILELAYRINNLVQDTNLQENQSDIDYNDNKDNIFWFEEEVHINTPEAKILNQIKNYISISSNINFGKLNTDEIKEDNLKNIFVILLELYKQSRFDPKTLQINIEQTLDNRYRVRKDYFVRQFADLYLKDSFVPFLNNQIYKDVYNAYCEYWILDENNIDVLRSNHPKQEIILAVKLLSELGLLKKVINPNTKKDDLYIYNTYRPKINFMEDK